MNLGKFACCVMKPKFPDPKVSPPGALNRGWLVTLTDSARNCAVTLSLIRTLLKIETSQLLAEGARSDKKREVLPNVKAGLAHVLGAGGNCAVTILKI